MFNNYVANGLHKCIRAASDWVPIISGVPQGSMSGPLLFILYTSEMFELVENRLFAYADDSTLLAVVRMPADKPDIAASHNVDVARIQESCNPRLRLVWGFYPS